ncbi:MAG: hypothetical protein CMF74_09590 [Maricaulis sp.]|jgi:uncharacterized protein (TIGR02186 family)|nr:hypothetical protein [Maricaulis sp.]HAQ35824.1 hypothetical protein [Alphaproteobacteria bacterium]|tara:strand:- start:57 stop:863 length:807 start_codon:yes stop_codon:yes gene_type:complete
MMRWLTLLALVVFVPRDSEAQEAPAQGPAIVAALTQERVDIRSDFAGTQLILFGAAQGLRETDDIVIVVRGPRENLRVMRQGRVLGIWVNLAPVRFESVPSYYTVASTRPLSEVGAFSSLRREGIGLDHLRLDAPDTEHREIRFGVEVTVSDIGAEIAEYRAAIARNRRRDELFAETDQGVELLDGGLFRAKVSLPPRTPVGDYTVDVYLFRNGRAVADRTITLEVRKAGLERIIFEFAHAYSWLYGLVCAALAVLFGWAAAAVFNRR